MTTKAIKDFISANISYKDGWEFFVGDDDGRAYLQIRFMEVCRDTGEMRPQHCRKYFLSPHMTKTELVQTCHAAVVRAEQHEINEKFKYRGQDIFNRHIDVDKLADLMIEDLNPFDYRLPH